MLVRGFGIGRMCRRIRRLALSVVFWRFLCLFVRLVGSCLSTSLFFCLFRLEPQVSGVPSERASFVAYGFGGFVAE